MSDNTTPVVNGRPWTSIIASGVVREWGALVVLAGVVAYLMWSGQERDKMVLNMMSSQTQQHGVQMAAHQKRLDELTKLLIAEIVNELKRVADNQDRMISLMTMVQAGQENLLPLVNALIQLDQEKPNTVPPGRVRPSLSVPGRQPAPDLRHRN